MVCSQLQPVSQECLDVEQQGAQVLFVVMNDNKVIHVACIALFLPTALDPLIQFIHVDVGKQLTGEISDRNARAGCTRLAIAINDGIQHSQQRLVSNPPSHQPL